MTAELLSSDLLRARGLSVTSQRVAILNAVSNNPHCTAENIVEATKKELGSVSKQAVYDTLNVLAEKGIIRRIQPASSAALYEDRVDDNHHHIVCRVCGHAVDVDCAVGSRPCLEAKDSQGFLIDEAEVIYWGTCPDCKK